MKLFNLPTKLSIGQNVLGLGITVASFTGYFVSREVALIVLGACFFSIWLRATGLVSVPVLLFAGTMMVSALLLLEFGATGA